MMITILQGDVIDQLRAVSDKSVHCCVTSPPYWGLRDYGVEGQIGLEKTPEEYTQKLVEVFREVKRVLRDDGTLWLNLGDSYSGSGCGSNDHREGGASISKNDAKYKGQHPGNVAGLKPKDLVGVPWRVAFALQADGWYLRSDIIWSKPNSMPESVTDRPNKAHEYVFLLSKKAKYYYDCDAVREPLSPATITRNLYARHGSDCKEVSISRPREPGEFGDPTKGRNRRTVWEIATQPTPDAHFATFPEALVEPCIKAGTSERGCCPVCGSPWERVVERTRLNPTELPKNDPRHRPATYDGAYADINGKGDAGYTETKTLGWQPTCTCTNADTIPCTVLDPFGGSGTTGLVARNLKRDAILIELNTDYVKIMRKKLRLNEQLGYHKIEELRQGGEDGE